LHRLWIDRLPTLRVGVELRAEAGALYNLVFIYWLRGRSGSDGAVGWPPDCSVGILRASLWCCGFVVEIPGWGI